jgi:dTMP kinase
MPDEMSGLFITFEGNEGSGKSTQIPLLAKHLESMGHRVRTLREPGGTPIGEEVRHTLKHSERNQAMTAEAELLLMNASRAQLVREVIRPALEAGEIIVCDRFYDSTLAYQGYGRGLDLKQVQAIIDFAVAGTRPDLTILLLVPEQLSEARRAARKSSAPSVRDRFEESSAEFFRKVVEGYDALAAKEPQRIRRVEARGDVNEVQARIQQIVSPLLGRGGTTEKTKD